MVLRPYHIILLDTLSNLVSDSSHDQSSGCNRVKDATKQGKDVTSVDLTKATDLILADIIGDSFSVLDKELGNWIRVVRGMSFYNPSDNSPVSYITGNPMGLYTSFAGLAHFHNDIYQFSYHLVTGKDEIFESYQVLGDDSCCWNKDVATVYKYLLTILDIPISEGKSYYSTPNESVSVAEFAKRTFKNGQELTGISPSLSVSVFGFGIDCDLVNLPMLLIHLESTGHIMSQVHSSWIDKSIKLSLPKASRRRIKAISLFTQVQIFLYPGRVHLRHYMSGTF
jgi:hypothetical protein